MILCLVRSSHYNGENISWANLKSQNAKSVEASKLNQWVISLPLIDQYWDLEDVSPSDHLVWWYSRLLHWVIYQYEDWIHERNKECAMVHQADQSFSSLRWLNTLSLFWNSKDLYKTIHFWFLIPNRNIQASWKMKFLRAKKVSSSSLKFKFPFMNFFQLSHFKVDSKICRIPLENGGRRWHYHCCDNFELNWYIDRSSILQSRTFVRTERRLTSGVGFSEWLQCSKLKI